MQKYPVALSYGNYPSKDWVNVPSRFRDELRGKLQDEMDRDSSLHLKVNTVISKQICVQEKYSTPLCFSVKMSVQLSRIDAAAYEYLLEHGTNKAYLDRFSPDVMWCFCTLIHEPVQL